MLPGRASPVSYTHLDVYKRQASLPALLATLLPPWARPRQLVCLEALPRLNTGKVDRRGTPALAAPRLVDWPLHAGLPCR